jgi:precorrin-8X/cobalt-precorrin-8 methylmutase
MSQAVGPVAILLISHGSPRTEANAGFTALVQRIAARLGSAAILPTFFSIVHPDIPDQVALLASQGVRRILLMPYFLFSGQHITADIPEIMRQCRQQHPNVELELLPTLENDPAVEDVVVERLSPYAGHDRPLPTTGAAIERLSHEIIEGQLRGWTDVDRQARGVVRRVIHATADISFGRTLRIHPAAVDRGRAALASGRPILCDVRMLQVGITKVHSAVLCAIDDEEVRADARRRGCTRAAAAMEKLAPQFDGAIVAIGNAPTALWQVLEIARRGGPRPALVVGLPVGFVGARESKLALLESDLCYITNTSPRGGSPVAAAAVNALALLDEKDN